MQKTLCRTLTKNYRKTNKSIREIEKEINAINSIIKDKKGLAIIVDNISFETTSRPYYCNTE